MSSPQSKVLKLGYTSLAYLLCCRQAVAMFFGVTMICLAWNSEASQNIPVVPHVSTGVLAQRVYVDTQGRYAAIFGQSMSENPESLQTDLRNLVPTTVVIVRLDDLKVTRNEKVVGDVREAFLDGENLYWIPKNVNLLNRLELGSEKDIQHLPFANPVLQLLPIGRNALAVYVEEDKKSHAKVFLRHDLKPIENHPLSAILGVSAGGRNSRVVYHLGDGLLSMHGRLINQDTGTTRCLAYRFAGTSHLIRMTGSGPTGSLHRDAKYAWKRAFFPGGVHKHEGAKLFDRVSRGPWDVSQTIPAVAVLKVKETRRKEPANFSIYVQDLVTGRIVYETSLPPIPPTGLRSTYSTQFLRFGGNRILVAFADKLFVCEIPKSLINSIESPLRLLYPQAAVAAFDKPMELSLEGKGGYPPYTYQLEGTLNGISLDEKTGLLKADLPEIWRQFIDDIISGKRRDVATARQMTKAGMHSFKSTTGIVIEDNQIGVGLPLTFRISDQAGHDDKIFVNIPVVGPGSDVDKALGQRSETQLQLRRERSEIQAKKSAKKRAHDRTANFNLGDFWFFASQALVYGIYLIVAVWYVWPWMAEQPLKRALVPICFVTSVRIIGSPLIFTGIFDEATPVKWLTPIGFADTIAAVLGLIVAKVLHSSSKFSIVAVWFLAAWGVGDTLLCYYIYMAATFEPVDFGSAYLVPIFAPTPAPVAYLLLLVYLVKRPDQALIH